MIASERTLAVARVFSIVGPMSRARTETKPSSVKDNQSLPLGPRVASILEIAYRSKRPALLEGPTGIGKSELVGQLAKKLGIQHVVLDLSLLEPPDLVGLPVIEDGRTRYALPQFLPREGKGILMLEELNRAERYIQQPALQLLTGRTLHEYVLPDGWACFAAINPETGDYQVTPLDAALRARFLQIPVRADRASWLAWAGTRAVHPAIVSLVRAHERIFADVPPRSWTFASDVLSAMQPSELSQPTLVSDVLSGYLPPIWVDALLSSGDLGRGDTSPLELDVHELLREYTSKGRHAEVLARLKSEGRTDRIDEITTRMANILRGPECGVLAARGDLKLEALEALFGDLPGDQRDKLQDALAGNATACVLLDVRAADVLTNYGGSPAMGRVSGWKNDPNKQHRIGLLVTSVRAQVLNPQSVNELRKSNGQRMSLGHFLFQVGERWGMPLVEALQKVGVAPIRPT